MYTVTSRLTFTVSKEDDGVPVLCIVDHPAVKDFQAQKYLEVQCKYFCIQFKIVAMIYLFFMFSRVSFTGLISFDCRRRGVLSFLIKGRSFWFGFFS